MTAFDECGRLPGEDWFDHARWVHEAVERQTRASLRSRAWARSRGEGGGVHELREIRDIVRNAVRLHGVPKGCRIELAVVLQAGAAAAGFEDAPEGFERPYILLDKGPYDRCSPEEVLNVYLGLGLHEAGHVLHTREGYRRMAAGLSPLRRLFENLWEDERIEALVRRKSRGFAPYLQDAKRALLERGELGQSLARWDELPDLDKVSALVFAFVRCPHLVTALLQAWTAINGECVFATLRSLFPAAPEDEADVERGGILLEQLLERLRRLYTVDAPVLPAVGGAGGGDPPPDAGERRRRQQQADAEDRALEGASADGKPDPEEAVRRLLQEAGAREEAGDLAGAHGLLAEALRWEEAGDP
ncbi:MAG TPA: hypothetical protein VJ739_19875, partial [Gemmataceae bacterium]|nr:hypothetical protein [Gemmataceae bacterium]